MRSSTVLAMALGFLFLAAQPALAQDSASDSIKLNERDRLWKEANDLHKQGKHLEALKVVDQVLAIERAVLGPDHDDVYTSLQLITRIQYARDDLEAAIKASQAMLDFLIRKFGRDDWRTVDVRVELEGIQAWKFLTATQQKKLLDSNDLMSRAYACDKPGKHQEGVGYAEKALALRLSVWQKETRSTGMSAYLVGRLWDHAHQADKARPFYERAVASFKSVLGTYHPETASCLNSLACLLDNRGIPAEAKPLHEQALAIRLKLFGEYHAATAESFHNLGHLLDGMGEYAEARKHYEIALAIRTKVLGHEHIDTSYTLNNLGYLLHMTGDHSGARPYYEQTLAIRLKILGPDHPDLATPLNNLGGLMLNLGDLARSRKYYERALELRQKGLGNEHPDTAISLHTLGTLLWQEGKFESARQAFEQALAIRIKVLGSDHPETARTMTSVANLLMEQGDFVSARPIVEKSLGIRKKLLGMKHLDTASSLVSMGLLLQRLEDFAGAQHYQEQALEIRKTLQGPHHTQVAECLSNLGAALWSQKKFDAARVALEESLDIEKKAFGEGHPGTATALNNLGTLLESMGDYDGAKKRFEEALTIRKKWLGDGHPETALSLRNLGGLLQFQGDHATAGEQFALALKQQSRNAEAAASGQSERQQLAMGASLRYYLDNLLTLHDKKTLSAEVLYDAVLAWKGTVMLRQHETRLLRKDPRLAPVADKLQTVATRLADLYSAAPADAKKLSEHRRLLAELTTEKEKLEIELASKSASFREAIDPARRNAVALRQALPKDTALIDFLFYYHSHLDASIKGKIRYERRLLAFLIRKDQPITLFDLGPETDIAQEIERWRIRSIKLDPLLGVRDHPGLALRKLLWQPLMKEVEGSTQVLVSPDGILGMLPFGALPGNDPKKFLLEEVAISVLPLPRLLPALLEQKADKEKMPTLLVVGDVDYQGEPGAQDTSPSRAPNDAGDTRKSWKALKGTRLEMVAVKETFQSRFPQGTVQLLDNGFATELAVRDGMQQRRWIHLATHGFFAAAKLKSAEAPPPPGDLFRQDGVVGFNPGLLTGVVLAGAGRPPELGRADGILTALEVGELDLRHAELVVLSACETGLGKVAGGEGLLGLQRSFQVAGTGAVVASLWEVSDSATQKLMERFYQNLWQKRLSKGEALRQAQLWMMREGPDVGFDSPLESDRGLAPPFFWAAFVLSGDWR